MGCGRHLLTPGKATRPAIEMRVVITESGSVPILLGMCLNI